jgi:hypothetical protein
MQSKSFDAAPHATVCQPDATRSPKQRVDFPVGNQVVQIPQSVATQLQSLTPQQPFLLNGTQVWIKRTNGNLVLRLGDIELESLGE